MQNRIGLEPLSTNFADAIRVAHEMKLQYIWIDAFCIIQDSSEDWAKESAKMAQYYKHADFMISGPHANHGLLHPRGSERNVARICTSRGEVFLRPQLYDVVSIVSDKSTSYIRPHVSYIPLNERAWTLQERVLSCHIIHFAEQQIVWQCKTCALSEDGQYTEISDRGSKGKLVDTIDLKVKHNRIHPDELVSVARTGRHDLLLEYTGRQLTYDEDKSPAISDLAREVAQIAEGKYIAGLSLRRLREGLFVAQIR
jgi:hypothetical protein